MIARPQLDEKQMPKQLKLHEKQYQVFLPLWFWIKYKGRDKIKHGAEYVSEHPPAIIAQEKATKLPAKKATPKTKKT